MVKVYFERGTHSELVATFVCEEIYLACLPALKRRAKKEGFDTVTEIVE